MTTAIVGRIGSGKTYTGKGRVEAMLAANRRVVIVDPTSAWWGLRLSAAGDGPSEFDRIVIFGGDHADVPFTPLHGEQLADLIVSGGVHQSIVDISDFSGNEQTTFLTPFFEQLYTRNRSALELVLDEADSMAPQNPLPETRRMLGAVDKIARRGRIRGLNLTTITQRPAVLHKNVLSQASTLIAMQLTSPQDRKAIEEWVKGSADMDEAKEVLGSLAKLDRGEGWEWTPGEGVLVRRRFPAISTYDSSRTPEHGETIPDVAPIGRADLEKIRAAFASAASPPADRPKKGSDAAPADPKAIEDAGRRAYETGFEDGVGQANRAAVRVMATWLEDLRGKVRAIADYLDASAKPTGLAVDICPPIAATFPASDEEPKIVADCEPPAERVERRPRGAGGSKLRPAVRAIVDAIHRAHPMALSFPAAAMRAGVSKRSSAYRQYEKEAEASGEIERRGDGRLTSAPGFSKPMDPGADPIEEFARRLSPSYGAMLRVVARRNGAPMSRQDIAAAAAISPTSSGLGAGLSELAALGLILRHQDQYRLAPELVRSKAA